MSYEADLLAEGLCAEIVIVDTEDGPVTGRCRQPVVTVTVPADPRYGTPEHETGFACVGHSEMILSWRAQSDAETIAWEREQDRNGTMIP